MSLTPEQAAEQVVKDTEDEFGVPASQDGASAWIDLSSEDSESQQGLERNLYGYADTTAEAHDLGFSYDRTGGHVAKNDEDHLLVVVTFWEAENRD